MADAPNNYCQREIERLRVKFAANKGFKRLVGYLYSNRDNIVMYVSEEYRDRNAHKGPDLGWRGFTFLPEEPVHSPW
jgi:hypothetical protein